MLQPHSKEFRRARAGRGARSATNNAFRAVNIETLKEREIGHVRIDDPKIQLNMPVASVLEIVLWSSEPARDHRREHCQRPSAAMDVGFGDGSNDRYVLAGGAIGHSTVIAEEKKRIGWEP